MREQLRDADFWKKVKDFGSKVPFAADAVAMFYALRDDATSLKDKAIIVGALVYWVNPFDLVPDFLISAGQLDDFTVIAAALDRVKKAVTPEHKARARAMLGLS